jgi:Ca2+-transporting ATPase
VTATGLDTEVGKLGVLVATQREPRTPLQHYMREVAHAALTIAIAVSVLVPLIGLLRGQPAEDMLLAGLTLAFATIPEELPILVSVLLAVGGRRLARKGALVRRLKAAEALGTITVVVTDKTGTLTENRLRLVEIVGDSAATLAAARAAADPEDLDPIDTAIAGDPDPRPVVRTIPFDPETKRATVVRAGHAAMKGAPEHVLQACAANPANPANPAALEAAARLAAQGRRVLAVAEGPTEHDLAFVGLLAFDDPIRPGVPEAVATLKAAGVRTLMITGDHPQTADAVARAVGIAPEDVTARATPADKLELVRRLQAAHERVAVTGDGVNDAPALAAADVGIAMGQRGTDLARQAAGVVLTDDAYPTVVAAVEGGRNIRSQLRRAVAFYLGAKVALVATIAASLVLGHAAAFAPVHVVLLELFMDLGASLAFVAEPPAPGLLRRPPPAPNIRFLDRHESAAIALVGLALAAGSIVAYLMANADAANNPRDTAVATWLIGHVLVAWALRARPTTPPAHNPLFLAWLAAAAITVAATLAPDPTPLAIGVLISTVLAFAGRRLLRLGATL